MTAFNNAFIYLLIATTVILIAVFFAMNVTVKLRHEAERQLRLASDEINDLYDNAPCGYHSLNSSGMFVNVNNTICRWLGYSKEEMIGKMRFPDVIIPEDVPVFNDAYSKFKATGSVYDLEFNLRKKNGATFPVILSAVALTDENGNYVKSRAITVDNTERKRAETQIRNLNHELEAFTYSVSHDLRAPLRSIDGYARILQEDYLDRFDEEGKRVLNVVMHNARRMGKLIDDLLDFARLGRKDLVRSQVNMNTLVRGIANELREQEAEKNIHFEIGELASAPVDVDMIRQVWVNLISNAIKYSGKKPERKIEIRSEEVGDEVRYSIRDNGVGFDMQYVGKLFGVFQRLHRVQDFSGTGVGLAIVKRIIDRHRGRVWAEGQINEGATFYFSIPTINGKQ